MATNLLPSLSALTLGIEAKENKQKAKVTPAPYSVIHPKVFQVESLPSPAIRTVAAGNASNATQAERAFLRLHYGNDWSNVGPALKDKLKKQARTVLAHTFAPILQDRLKEAEYAFNVAFKAEHYNAEGLVKLDFKDLVPFLNQRHPPDWRKAPDGTWLSQSEKDARVAASKAAWRADREVELAKKRASEWSTLRETVLTEKIDELNFPDNLGVRRARALLRHWFNRPGSDGKKRDWRSSVEAALSKKRLAWAKAQVLLAGYDHTNPPQPSQDLYAPGDVNPFNQFFLPDPVDAVSKQGGQWVWKYMRALSSADIEHTQEYTNLKTVKDALVYWNESFRAQQIDTIKGEYTEFINSLNDMPQLPGAKGVALSYTQGSGKFNKYILWPSSKIGGDPTKIPLYGAGGGGVGGNMMSGDIGPPDLLHRLYKLINRCPRLQSTCLFIRGVNSKSELPHNLGKTSPVAPVVGRGYLNVTFMSTSTAAPADYLSGNLSHFYNETSKCCLYIITAPGGTPVLPLVLGGGTSQFADEQEVMLPPGLVLVFQGTSQELVGSDTTTIHFYEARQPPSIPLPAH